MNLEKKCTTNRIGIVLLVFTFFIFSVLFCIAVIPEIQTEINDTSESKVFSGGDFWNEIFYIKMAKHATIFNASVNLTGQFSAISNNLFNIPELANLSNGIDWLDTDIAVDSKKDVHIIICSGSIARDVHYYKRTSGVWSEEIVTDNLGGGHCSIEVDSNDIPHICYENDISNILTYGNRTGGTWRVETVTTATNMADDCDIAIDSNDNIGIVSEETGNDLMYSFLNKTTNVWLNDRFFNGSVSESIDEYISMVFDNNDRPHIAVGILSALNDLYFWNRSDGSWKKGSFTSGSVGRYASIVVDTNNKVHISHSDTDTEKLHYATNSDGTWSDSIIRNSSVSMGETRIGIVNDLPAVLYQEYDSGTTTRILTYGVDDGSWNFTNVTVKPGFDPNIFNMDIKSDITYMGIYNISRINLIENGQNTRNTLLLANDVVIFNNTGTFNTVNRTQDFASTYNTFLAGCTMNNLGLCFLPFNISSSNSSILMNGININFSDIPIVNITSPLNRSNFTTSQINISSTVFETSLDTCWYSNDTFSVNNTFSCNTNITGITWSDGFHNITVFANDTVGNSNFSKIKFTVDTTAPVVSIIKPIDFQEFSSNFTLNLNYTIFDTVIGIDKCWFNIDKSVNRTLDNCVNATYNTTDGAHILYFFANDTLNNIRQLTVNFTISLNSPAITIDSPIDGNFFNRGTNVYINYTATDDNVVDRCEIWHNMTGDWHLNNTKDGSSGDQLNVSYDNSDGDFITNVFCNDSLGNGNFSNMNISFVIDTLDPVVNVNSITSAAGSQTVNFTFDYTELHCKNAFYSVYDSLNNINNGLANISLDCNESGGQFVVSAFSTYNLSITVNDSASNIGEDNLGFETSSEATVIVVNTGGGGGGGRTDTKVDCDIILNPANVTFFLIDNVKLVRYANNENFSITPSFELNPDFYEIRSSSATIPAKETIDVTIIKNNNHDIDNNVSRSDLMTITSAECITITATVSFAAVGNLQVGFESFLDFLTIFISKVNLFGLQFNFIIFVALSSIIVFFLINLADTDFRTKLISSIFIILTINIFMAFLAEKLPQQEIVFADTIPSYLIDIFNTEVLPVSLFNFDFTIVLWHIGVLLLGIIITSVLIFRGRR